MKYQQFIDIAKTEANKSTMRSKYGAVLILNGKIISKGHNHCNMIHSKVKECFLCG